MFRTTRDRESNKMVEWKGKPFIESSRFTYENVYTSSVDGGTHGSVIRGLKMDFVQEEEEKTRQFLCSLAFLPYSLLPSLPVCVVLVFPSRLLVRVFVSFLILFGLHKDMYEK